MSFLKKHASNILFAIFLVLLFIPQTGRPIRVFMNRLVSFAPPVQDEEDREVVDFGDWTLVDMEGNVVRADAFKGKHVFISFWATWCPPCIAEMPSIQALYNDMKDREDVAFLLVSHESKEAILKFTTKESYSFPIYGSINNPPELLQSNSLPTTFLINKKGQVVIHKTGAADWDSERVRDLLK